MNNLITICKDCKGDIEIIPPDELNYCEDCQQTEGPTIEVTEEEHEKINFPWLFK